MGWFVFVRWCISEQMNHRLCEKELESGSVNVEELRRVKCLLSIIEGVQHVQVKFS